MTDALHFVFQSFWTFAGTFLLVALPFRFAFRCWNRFMRMLNIRARGWPPSHCDADGEFEEKEDG